MGSFDITRRNGEVFTVLVDDEDLPAVLAAGPWHIAARETTTYAARNIRTPAGNRTIELLHRFLVPTSDGRYQQIDHADGNGLNNCRSNLRVCRPGENVANTRIRSDNKSGHKGIRWCTNARAWQVRVSEKMIGSYSTLERAIEVRRAAFEATYREFARHE